MGADIGRVLEKELNFSFLTQLFLKKGGTAEAQPREQLQMVGGAYLIGYLQLGFRIPGRFFVPLHYPLRMAGNSPPAKERLD